MLGLLIATMRPKQWVKNLLVFAGVVFSQHVGEGPHLLRAAAGFVAFSLLSGGVYLVNDLRDIESDRRHPEKCKRPLASGRLAPGAARAFLVPLGAAVVALTVWLGPSFAWVAATYLVINLAYNTWLKRQVLLDVFTIALGFVLRAIAGVELLRPVEPTVALSPWLLVCTFFLALFLGLAKRRRELGAAGDAAQHQRAVLAHYNDELLDSLLLVCAAATLLGYALYTIWPGTVEKFHTEALLYTVPFVAYGIFRYLYLVKVEGASEDPSQVLFTDRPLLLAIVLWALTVAVILYRP
jgi:4-hydroxybenzoate polyprenyltransferase